MPALPLSVYPRSHSKGCAQMKCLILASAILALAVCPATFAQKQNPTSFSQAAQSTDSTQNLAVAQQIRQDLKAGFTDVKVVADSFVVQARTRERNPVVMTIGPHGMSVFQAMNGTAGSTASMGGSATGSASSSQRPK